MGRWPLLQCMFSHVQLVEIGEAEQSTAPGPPGWGLSMGPIIPGPPHRNWSWLWKPETFSFLDLWPYSFISAAS